MILIFGMSTERVETLKSEILKLKKDLKNEKQRYDNLYKTTLEISNDFMKYTEKHPNHDPNDDTDALNLIKLNYDDIRSFNFNAYLIFFQ